jgi:hypothetical protein
MAKIEIIIKAIDQATNELSRTQGKVVRFSEVVGNAFKKMLPIVGFALIAHGMKTMIEESVELGDRTVDLSHRLGLSIDAVQRLDFIAQRSGTSIDALSRGIKALSIAAYNNSDVLKKLGIATKDAAGNTRDVSRLFNDTVIALSKIPNPAERAAVATKIFGKASVEVLGIAAKGEIEIRALTDAYEKMGGSLSDEKIQKLHEAKEAMENLQFAMQRLGATAASELGPALIKTVELLTKMVGLAGKWGGGLVMAGRWLPVFGGESIGKMREEEIVKTAEKEKDINFLFAIRAEKLKEINRLQLENDAINARSNTYEGVTASDYDKQQNQKIKNLEKLGELSLQSKRIQEAMARLLPGKKTGAGRGGGGGGGGGGEVKKGLGAYDKGAFDIPLPEYFDDKSPLTQSIIKFHSDMAGVAADNAKKAEELEKEHRRRLVEIDRYSDDYKIANIRDAATRERAELQNKFDRMKEDHAGYKDEVGAIDRQYIVESTALENRLYQEKRKTMWENAKYGIDLTTDNLHVMASKWKEFGNIYKTMAITQATIDTYTAAQGAYKSMASIPYVGVALGIAAAAATVGAGLARVAMISQQQFARGTPSAPSGLHWVGEQGPELMRFRGGERVYSNSQSRTLRMGGAGGTVNMGGIVINGSVDKSTLPAIVSAQERQARLLRDMLRSGAGRNAVIDFKRQLARV